MSSFAPNEIVVDGEKMIEKDSLIPLVLVEWECRGLASPTAYWGKTREGRYVSIHSRYDILTVTVGEEEILRKSLDKGTYGEIHDMNEARRYLMEVGYLLQWRDEDENSSVYEEFNDLF